MQSRVRFIVGLMRLEVRPRRGTLEKTDPTFTLF